MKVSTIFQFPPLTDEPTNEMAREPRHRRKLVFQTKGVFGQISRAWQMRRNVKAEVREARGSVVQASIAPTCFLSVARLRDLALPLSSRRQAVDLNYLYHRHGVSLMLAKAAASSCARIVHEKMAAAYAKQIADCCPAERRAYWLRREAYLTVPFASRSERPKIDVSAPQSMTGVTTRRLEAHDG